MERQHSCNVRKVRGRRSGAVDEEYVVGMTFAGKWYSFKTEKNADGVYSITLISPEVPYGYQWQAQP